MQVAIDLPNNNFCGGTIVNANHIVTAARCVFTIQTHLIAANLVTIRAGVVDLNTNPPRLNVVAIFPHPQYNPFTNQNNVAVLRVIDLFYRLKYVAYEWVKTCEFFFLIRLPITSNFLLGTIHHLQQQPWQRIL